MTKRILTMHSPTPQHRARNRRRFFSTAILLAALGSGCGTDEGEDAGNIGDPTVRLSISSLYATTDLAAWRELRDYVLVADVTVENVGREHPIPLSESLFSVEMSDLSIMLGSRIEAERDGVVSCGTDLLLAPNGRLTCAVAFELDLGPEAKALRYQTDATSFAGVIIPESPTPTIPEGRSFDDLSRAEIELFCGAATYPAPGATAACGDRVLEAVPDPKELCKAGLLPVIERQNGYCDATAVRGCSLSSIETCLESISEDMCTLTDCSACTFYDWIPCP